MADLIVNKPQFDTNKLAPGTAVHVSSTRDRNDFYNFNRNCLIVSSTPLALELAYVDPKAERHLEGRRESMGYKTLSIDLVASEVVNIQILERKV